MSRLNSRSSSAARWVAGAAVLSCALVPSVAAAQACCSGGGAYAPARLKLFEEALVGIQLKADYGLGSFDSGGRYDSNPAGDSEVDLEEDVFAGYRFNDHSQLGVTIPFVETSRTEAGLSEFGGSIGDITLHTRYDFILPGNLRHIPGVALLAAVTAPSGRAPDQAKTPLAVDATGTGYWQGSVGLGLEQILGHWVLDLGASLWGALPRTVGAVHEVLGPQPSGRFSVGYSFHNGSALALSFNYSNQVGEWINNEPVPGGGQALLTTGVALGWPINYQWRIQAAVSDDLPILGRNHVAGLGATTTVLRTW